MWGRSTTTICVLKENKMNILKIGLIILTPVCLLFVKCSKKQEVIILKPSLFITLRDSAGKGVSGATVRLYKDAQDSGITQISDTTGVVLFQNLEAKIYYWLAQKGCSTNRNSKNTINRPLIQGVVLYGYSLMSATGILKITNTSAEPYKISDSLFNIKQSNGFNITLSSDTPYIAYPRVGSYVIHSEKVSTPGIGKDTLIKVQCGDTSIIFLSY